MLPDKMRAAVLYGKEDVRMEEVPVPRPNAGELLVRVDAALTCGTDLKVFRRGYHARMIQPPALFGHEFAGTIVAVGADAQFSEGDRVVSANSAPCGACFFCRRGEFSICEDLLFFNGAYAQYILIPARIARTNCHRIPDPLPAEHAALSEPLACAVKGIEDVGVRAGETVAVMGAGPLGLMHVCLAAMRGAFVIAIDKRGDRLELARKLGAQAVVQPDDSDAWVGEVRALSNGGYGVDRAVEAVGLPDTWESAIRLVRRGGIINLFGGCPSGTHVRVDTARMHYEEVRLIASFHLTPATHRGALNLIATGMVPAELWIGDRRPLDELPQVFADMMAGTAPPKTAIVP